MEPRRGRGGRSPRPGGVRWPGRATVLRRPPCRLGGRRGPPGVRRPRRCRLRWWASGGELTRSALRSKKSSLPALPLGQTNTCQSEPVVYRMLGSGLPRLLGGTLRWVTPRSPWSGGVPLHLSAMSRQSLASPRATGVALLLGKPARLRGKAPEARQTLRQGRPGGDVRASSTRGVSAFREGPVTGPASRKRPTSPGSSRTEASRVSTRPSSGRASAPVPGTET